MQRVYYYTIPQLIIVMINRVGILILTACVMCEGWQVVFKALVTA